LTAQRKPMLASAGVAVAFVLTASLNVILVPSHGGAGAALATTVGQTCGGVAAAVLFLRALGGRFADLLPRPADAAWLWRKARNGLAPPATQKGAG
jgi:O-antigen/teichoic acid export membrane protein